MTAAAGILSPAARTQPELADLFAAHVHELVGLSGPQLQAVRAITACRTAALGGHVSECDRCGHREISYNSCRNRHCPKCEGLKKARWVEARRADLLPVEYHHVVFTIPRELHPIFRACPKVALNLLFSAVAETLLDVAENPKRLGARIGFTAVLHTWTQTLQYHPHIHCIVPGGGISPQENGWIFAKPGFFLPVQVLSKVFRGKLLEKLEKAAAKGKIALAGGTTVTELLVAASLKSWVVYSKPPVAGPEAVLDYLGRYTHRIAIGNERLVAFEEGRVTFRWTDRADGNRPKLMTLDAVEFLRRFLQHVLPKGLVRIRHYGFLANAVRRRELVRCRQFLHVPEKKDEPASPEIPETWQEELFRLTGRDVTACPKCHEGRLVEKEIVPRTPSAFAFPGRARSP